MASRKRVRVVAGVLSLAVVAAAAAGCSTKSTSTTNNAGGQPIQGGVVNIADIAGGQPTAIWPFLSAADNNAQNGSFMSEFYRGMYFLDDQDQVGIDYNISPANAPTWSNGDKTVTVDFKGWKWSNGETVDAADALFYLNIFKANKTQAAAYTPPVASIGADYIPDNIVSATADGNVLTLNLDKSYNAAWFTQNELTDLTPMPQAWDLTAAGTPGHCFTDTYGSAAALKDCVADYT